MERMINATVLKKSQKGRPRKWIPWLCLVTFLLSAAMGAYYLLLIFTDNPLSQALIQPFNGFSVVFLGQTYPGYVFMVNFLLPLIYAGVNIFPFVVSMILCHYRGVYWWYGALILIGSIAVDLLTLGYQIFTLFPNLGNLLGPAKEMVLNILGMGMYYGTFVLPFVYALFMLFGMFYNVNYPGKYERIYELRKKRIKSLPSYDEKAKYKKRFYYDYMFGRWDSMMLDLFAIYLDGDSNEKMPKDAFEFMLDYSMRCDGRTNRAIFNEMAAQGRYKECRAYYAKAKARAETAEHAHIVLPHYEPEPPKKKPAPQPKPARLDPPLAPAKVKRQPDARVRTWAPEDIG